MPPHATIVSWFSIWACAIIRSVAHTLSCTALHTHMHSRAAARTVTRCEAVKLCVQSHPTPGQENAGRRGARGGDTCHRAPRPCSAGASPRLLMAQPTVSGLVKHARRGAHRAGARVLALLHDGFQVAAGVTGHRYHRLQYTDAAHPPCLVRPPIHGARRHTTTLPLSNRGGASRPRTTAAGSRLDQTATETSCCSALDCTEGGLLPKTSCCSARTRLR